ncbi:homeodomain-only protein-like [Bacillus rossius redtenbacheri]|uniref:homeodomain-only protein-like n=1 Tax=Bacillus rossius redtenbacheri TaxID=93214 RepID=UPI002FDCD59F
MLQSVSPRLPAGAVSRAPRISPEQESALEAQFRRVKNPHPTDLELLAAETGLDERDVQVWYAQRLAAWRLEQGLSPSKATPLPR